LDTLTTGAMLSTAVAITAFPINLLNGGSTGNEWGDAVMKFLAERGIPSWAGLFIGDLYVELLDKLLILIAMYIIVHVVRFILKLIRNRKKPKEENGGSSPIARTAALLLAAGMGLSAIWAAGPSARAEEKTGSGTVNYNDYVKTVFSKSNSLPCGEANDIAMTNDGILWIGTYAGLYRYNGKEFRRMSEFDSVRNVNCLYVDEEGRLWIGTNDNGLSIMINEKIVNVIDKDRGLPNNSVKSIIRSSDGYYYIGTKEGVQVLTLNTGLQRVGIISEVICANHLAADRNGNVAAVTKSGILYLLRQGKVVTSIRRSSERPVFTTCTFEEDGSLLVATKGDSIHHFRIEEDSLKELEFNEYPGLKNIKTLMRLENGELFICADNGIAHLSPDGAYEQINTGDFNNSIDNMLVDYQGNLWFTSSRLGLLRMAPSDFRDIYSSIAGMNNKVVNAIACWNGVYYFGTDKGIDAVDADGNRQIEDEVTAAFSANRIRCMTVDRENHLWICTYEAGLAELEPDGTRHDYNAGNGAFENATRVVTQLADGTIAAGGDSGLVFIRNHKVEDTINHDNGEISTILTISELPDGTILAGSDGEGLAVIRDRKVTAVLTRTDGLSSEVILRTVTDTVNGGAYIVTSNGLCYMEPDHTVRLLDRFPYYNNYNIWIRDEAAEGEEDAEKKTLFILSSAGIYLVDRDELLTGTGSLSYDLLDVRRGLNGGLTANAWTWFTESENELYLPCDTGVFVLNTETLSGGRQYYRMYVSGIKAGDTVYRAERNATTRIPRESTKIEIMPEVINYTIQDPNVGYILEGFDTDWTVVSQNSLGSIVYSNLPVGDYVFHLAVLDSQENIIAERTYPLSREKEMYDNDWFIIYILFVPMFTVFWVTWLLLKHHEMKVKAQLAEANRQIEMGKQTVAAIARAVDAKDERTGGHSTRVALYSGKMAKAYGMTEKQCREIEWAAQLHDIGKIAIPDAILNKDSRLTDEEYATMKSHTVKGADILKDFTLLDHVTEGAMYHHERPDGRGYPRGLKGEDIPLYARIIGVADAFDAMTANRVYRKQMDFGYVLGELEKGRGTQFAPEFVDILLELIRTNEIDLNELYGIKQEDAGKPEETTQKAEKPDAPAPGKEA
ncbi:MAG: HD domain-containing protein, partial [Clostridiales bacterium]|nr:HD domain-containing protein [Clostridiales bacterium]